MISLYGIILPIMEMMKRIRIMYKKLCNTGWCCEYDNGSKSRWVKQKFIKARFRAESKKIIKKELDQYINDIVYGDFIDMYFLVGR